VHPTIVAPLRATLLVLIALAAVALVGCGSSGDQTASGGFTVPSDVHGLSGELEAVLDQLPYQHWYTRCVIGEVEKDLTPAEAEALSGLSESEREQKVTAITAEAGPNCEKKTNRPPIDPNASSKELELLRAGYMTSMKTLAEANELTANQTSCVEERVESLPGKALIAIGNGTDKVREGILLSVFKPCARVK
jgi:hypothetical protein